MNHKVNLLIIGAGRSGTTSLCSYFTKHNNICFSDIKEVHYFSLEDLHNRGEIYLHSYFQHSGEKIIGTADTYLLIDSLAPEKVYDYNPKIKIIIMMREPIARAYSSYNYAINNGYQNKGESFLESIHLEKDRCKNLDIIQKNNLCHIEGSLYHKYIQNWQHYFPKENFLFIKTEDLDRDHLKVLNLITSFLEIEKFSSSTEEIRINKAAPVKSKGLQQFLLNRNHPLRNIIRPIAKPLKGIITKSGIVDMIYKINKTETRYKNISEEEMSLSYHSIQEDLKNLKMEYDISWI